MFVRFVRSSPPVQLSGGLFARARHALPLDVRRSVPVASALSAAPASVHRLALFSGMNATASRGFASDDSSAAAASGSGHRLVLDNDLPIQSKRKLRAAARRDDASTAAPGAEGGASAPAFDRPTERNDLFIPKRAPSSRGGFGRGGAGSGGGGGGWRGQSNGFSRGGYSGGRGGRGGGFSGSDGGYDRAPRDRFEPSRGGFGDRGGRGGRGRGDSGSFERSNPFRARANESWRGANRDSAPPSFRRPARREAEEDDSDGGDVMDRRPAARPQRRPDSPSAASIVVDEDGADADFTETDTPPVVRFDKNDPPPQPPVRRSRAPAQSTDADDSGAAPAPARARVFTPSELARRARRLAQFGPPGPHRPDPTEVVPAAAAAAAAKPKPVSPPVAATAKPKRAVAPDAASASGDATEPTKAAKGPAAASTSRDVAAASARAFAALAASSASLASSIAPATAGDGKPAADSAPASTATAPPVSRKASKAAFASMKPAGEFVFGTYPVLAALQSQKRRVFHKLFIQREQSDSEDVRREARGKGARETIEAAAARVTGSDGKPLEIVYGTRDELRALTSNRPHNGFVLDAAPLAPTNIETLPVPSVTAAGGGAQIWCVLDEITDPQNIGAIMRTALFFGASGIVVPAENSAGLTPVASKASSGAMESLPLFAAKDLSQFLANCRKERITEPNSKWSEWRIIGMDVSPGSIDCKQLIQPALTSGVPTLLVVGSEGRGLRDAIRSHCTQTVQISPASTFDAAASTVDSLNVSNAVAVALYSLAK